MEQTTNITVTLNHAENDKPKANLQDDKRRSAHREPEKTRKNPKGGDKE